MMPVNAEFDWAEPLTEAMTPGRVTVTETGTAQIGRLGLGGRGGRRAAGFALAARVSFKSVRAGGAARPWTLHLNASAIP